MIFLAAWRDIESHDCPFYIWCITCTAEGCWWIVPSIVCSFGDEAFPISICWIICAIAHNFENFSKGFFFLLSHVRYVFCIVICILVYILSILKNKSTLLFSTVYVFLSPIFYLHRLKADFIRWKKRNPVFDAGAPAWI